MLCTFRIDTGKLHTYITKFQRCQMLNFIVRVFAITVGIVLEFLRRSIQVKISCLRFYGLIFIAAVTVISYCFKVFKEYYTGDDFASQILPFFLGVTSSCSSSDLSSWLLATTFLGLPLPAEKKKSN